MKNALLLAASLLLVSLTAQADTVKINSVTDMNTPSGSSATSSGTASFVGPNTIIFTVVGKVCKWTGSATAIGPKGCNYAITVNNSTGALSNPSNADSNSGCTQASQMLDLCR